MEREGIKYFHPVSTATRVQVGKVKDYHFDGLFRDNKALGMCLIFSVVNKTTLLYFKHSIVSFLLCPNLEYILSFEDTNLKI